MRLVGYEAEHRGMVLRATLALDGVPAVHVLAVHELVAVNEGKLGIAEAEMGFQLDDVDGEVGNGKGV